MKTIKNIFGIKQSKKLIDNISSKLNNNDLIKIKGGEGEDNGDLWSPPPPPPPPTSTTV